MITAVSQVIVLNQEAQVSHLPDLQFWGFWGISGMTEGKGQGHCIQYTGCCMGFIYKNKMHCNGAYRRPHVLFGSLMLFSGAFPPPNHFFVAVNRDRLRPFLDTSCGQGSKSCFQVLGEVSETIELTEMASVLSQAINSNYAIMINFTVPGQKYERSIHIVSA